MYIVITRVSIFNENDNYYNDNNKVSNTIQIGTYVPSQDIFTHN